MTRRLLIAAAAALLILFPTLFAHAQSQPVPNATVAFSGVVQSANATALVINGRLIDISAAQINAPLVPGLAVRVRASYAENGSLFATQIDPITPGLIPGLVEINGEITDLTENTIRIRGHLIDMTNAIVSGTLRFGNGASATVFAVETLPNVWSAVIIVADADFPTATPEVGAPAATAEVIPVQTPEVAAPVITPEAIAPLVTPEVVAPASTPEVEDGEDFDIRGRLDGFTDAEVIVNGRRYFIGGAEIDGRLVPGAQVRLEIRVVNGQWVLQEIKVEGSGSDDDRGGSSGSGSSGGSDDDNRGSSSGSSNSGSGSSGSGSGNSGSGGSNSGSGGGGGDSSGRGGGDDD
jgi:hypothetical protein